MKINMSDYLRAIFYQVVAVENIFNTTTQKFKNYVLVGGFFILETKINRSVFSMKYWLRLEVTTDDLKDAMIKQWR